MLFKLFRESETERIVEDQQQLLSANVRFASSAAGGDRTPSGHSRDRWRRPASFRKLISLVSRGVVGQFVRRLKRQNNKHEKRRNRGDRAVSEPRQRQRPAGAEGFRCWGAGVRLPCLLLRADREWEGGSLWALLHQVTCSTCLTGKHRHTYLVQRFIDVLRCLCSYPGMLANRVLLINVFRENNSPKSGFSFKNVYQLC